MSPPAGDDRARFEADGPIGRLRLVRGPHNGIDHAMTVAIDAAVAECQACDGMRVLVVTAEGGHFSVGGDLRELTASGDGVGDLLDDMIGRYHRSLAAIAALPVPVVCGAQGAVAGGGLGLLWASDVAIGADDLRLVLAFADIGLTGDGGSSWYLPRLVGLRRALDLVMAGGSIGAEQALDLGLISSVVPAADLADAVETAALRLAEGPTRALAGIRRLYREGLDRTLVDQLAAEQAAIVDIAVSADGREGVGAFAARRPPRFEGR